MNFFENWYTSSHWHNNNTGKVSWTSEVWIKRYEKVLDRQTDTQTDRLAQTGYLIVHRRKLFVGDKNIHYKETEIVVNPSWLKARFPIFTTLKLTQCVLLSDQTSNWPDMTEKTTTVPPKVWDPGRVASPATTTTVCWQCLNYPLPILTAPTKM